MARILLTDMKFGRLRIIRKVRPEVYLCRCSCGNTIELWKSQLWCKVVRHCGCQLHESVRKKWAKRGLTMETAHMRSFTKKSGAKCSRTTWEYNSWHGMNMRCYYPKAGLPELYANYGGRGIRVCERWRRDHKNRDAFRNFLADMGPRPQGTSLDRIDVQGHYEPTNCRWATQVDQIYNQRRFVFKDEAPPPVEKVKVMEARVEDFEAELAEY